MELSIMLELAAKVLAALVVSVLMFLAPKVRAYLVEKIGEEKTTMLVHTVSTLVVAAEQMLKDTDPTGEKRKAYVVEQLHLMEIEVSGYVDALIESLVYNLH